MKHLIICLASAFIFFAFGHAQTPEQMKKSDEVISKMRQIDLLTQIIPLALNKDQIEKLLPFIERARSKVTQTQKDEATRLEKLDLKISAAVKKSIETMVAPPKALLDELAETTLDMSNKREVVIAENTTNVLKAFDDICNAGQKKAAANSLAPQLFDSTLKPDKMTDQEKIKFFVQQILLDPLAYGILLDLEKHSS